MKQVKKISNLVWVLSMSLMVSALFAFNAVATAAVFLFGSQLSNAGTGFASMAVTKEIWENDIIGNLFKDNQFAARAVSGDQYVVNGKVVHIPVAGAPTASQKNPSSFPISGVQRTDTDILYSLDNYFQAPKFVQNIEQYELSYDKRQSIMGEMNAQLIQDAMDGLLYRWAFQSATDLSTPGNSILTVGSATAATISGATGNRKLFDATMFGKVKLAMDRANISPNGRTALLTADHYQQLLDSLTDAARTNFYRLADMQKGIMGQYLGFDVIMRSTIQRWRLVSSVWTPVDEQASGFAASTKTGDSAASLFWQQDAVERARGEVNVFEETGRADYYGDLFSMNMRLGGRQRRTAGVWSVIEDIAS